MKTAAADDWDLPEDANALAHIAENDQNPLRRQAAFERWLDHLDLNELAQIAGHDPTLWRRQAAFNRLLPCIQTIAGRVRRRRYHRATSEIVDEAPRIIWKRMEKYDKHKGTFLGWCGQV